MAKTIGFIFHIRRLLCSSSLAPRANPLYIFNTLLSRGKRILRNRFMRWEAEQESAAPLSLYT